MNDGMEAVVINDEEHAKDLMSDMKNGHYKLNYPYGTIHDYNGMFFWHIHEQTVTQPLEYKKMVIDIHPGLKLSRGTDGYWLNFDDGDGHHGRPRPDPLERGDGCRRDEADRLPDGRWNDQRHGAHARGDSGDLPAVEVLAGETTAGGLSPGSTARRLGARTGRVGYAFLRRRTLSSRDLW